MMNTKVVVLLFFFGLSTIIIIFLFRKEMVIKSSKVELSISFTGDINGRLEPCGCFSGQHGGMTRMNHVFDKMGFLGQKEQLRIDVGDSIKGQKDYDLIQFKYIMKAFNEYKYDAVNIGKREASLSLIDLENCKTWGGDLIVSANLVYKKSGKPIFNPYKILEKGSKKIAIIGLVDPSGLRTVLDENVAINEMDLALQNIIPNLRSQVDSIVVVAFAKNEKLKELAKEFIEIKLILGGDVAQPSQELEKVSDCAVLTTTNDSRAMGWYYVTINEKNKWVDEKFEMVFMSEMFPESKSIISINEKYKEEIRNAILNIDKKNFDDENAVPGVKANMTYVGSESCATCHSDTYDKWSKTQHAHAFNSLKNKNADADPNCIKCHTVGFEKPGGYMRSYKDQKLINVGCENCHGPGSEHVKQRAFSENKVYFKFRPIGESDCRSCHYGEFSRPFQFKEFWEKIKH